MKKIVKYKVPELLNRNKTIVTFFNKKIQFINKVIMYNKKKH